MPYPEEDIPVHADLAAIEAAVSPWERFLAEPTVMFSFVPDATSDDLLLVAQRHLAEVPDRDRLLLVESWPRLGVEGDVIARKLWQLAQPAHHDAFQTQVAELNAALPTVTIESLPLGSLLETLVNGLALSETPLEHFFTSDLPHGTEALHALAGLVIDGARAVDGLPGEPTEDMALTTLLVDNYAALTLEIEDLVGGTLLPPPAISELVWLEGSDEDDLLVLEPNVDFVVGGDGIDQLLIQAQASASDIIFDEAEEIRLRVGEQELHVQGVERLVFDDGVIAFDDMGLAGQAYRLYQACFDRVPDAEGLGFWIRHLDAGNVTLTETAGFFLTSEEFARVYGTAETVNDFDYLTLLYANVLDRAPDEAGFEFWRNQQENGLTRSDMLVYFSESTENIAKVASAIDDGIWYL